MREIQMDNKTTRQSMLATMMGLALGAGERLPSMPGTSRAIQIKPCFRPGCDRQRVYDDRGREVHGMFCSEECKQIYRSNNE